MIKDIRAMFLTPVYVFSFADHEKMKPFAMEYLQNEEVYKDYSGNHINLTAANLYKEQIFRPFYYFMHECIQYAMDDLGYVPDHSITAMWATKQEPGMYHHPHKHGNTFLAGTYYLNGSENTFGTTFFNPDNLLQISPNINFEKPARLNARFSTPFVEGDFVVFPAWTLHGTNPNLGPETRYTIGVNSMPVGKTVDEPYDRFNYPDARRIDLEYTEEELSRYKQFAKGMV
jgi:hypothetical protein